MVKQWAREQGGVLLLLCVIVVGIVAAVGLAEVARAADMVCVEQTVVGEVTRVGRVAGGTGLLRYVVVRVGAGGQATATTYRRFRVGQVVQVAGCRNADGDFLGRVRVR